MRDPAPRTLVLTQAASLGDLRRDFSLSASVAGIIAVMVSYGGPAAIIFQAASLAGLSADQLTSWIWAISIGSGLCGLVLSLLYRAPVIIAWSTPGAALLAAGWAAYPYPEAIGAFVFAAVAITVCGATGLFGALMERIPQAVVAAMLAGILFRFGVEVFMVMCVTLFLITPILIYYLTIKHL